MEESMKCKRLIDGDLLLDLLNDLIDGKIPLDNNTTSVDTCQFIRSRLLAALLAQERKHCGNCGFRYGKASSGFYCGNTAKFGVGNVLKVAPGQNHMCALWARKKLCRL